MVTGEYAPMKSLILVGNTGVHFRPRTAINQPTNNDGLGVGTEWRWAIGAFIPLKDGKYRVGGSIMGQTGLMFNDSIVGSTAFKYQTTPIEWNGEFRMKFGPHGRWWTGAGAGTRILGGYGAPDLRVLATIGTSFPIEDSRPEMAPPQERFKKGIVGAGRDTDGDGVPDSVDPCPLEKEDGKDPDPTDGCPAPPDRDGDGVLDVDDKCPDEAEDKDGIDDEDGCPEKDVDADGIIDEKDACPRVPGKPNDDPAKNGCPTLIVLEKSQVRVLQQVKFATGSATILPASFAMLQEVVDLLKVTPSIKSISVEGHTDNVASAAYNLDLSRKRAASVKKWLIDHGVASTRLTSEGYGLTKPIGDNKTNEGRAANRRVEFKIVAGAAEGDDEAPKSTDDKDESAPK
jgi:outer membrane protein OmpA-like peptidoglycan-associated protein